MTQLMNLPASFEPYRGSGRRWVLLAVNFRAMKICPAGVLESCPVEFVLVHGSGRTGGATLAHFFLAAGAAAFLRWAPYFERACFRSPTPWQSRTPRTIW